MAENAGSDLVDGVKDPEVEALLKSNEDVDETQVEAGVDGADGEAGADTAEADKGTEDGDEAEKTVPYKQFARVYGESAESKKALKAERARAEAAERELDALRRGSKSGQTTNAAGGPKSAIDVLREAIRQEVAPLRARTQLMEAKEVLDGFWQENPEFTKDYRTDVDRTIYTAVKDGIPLEELNPDLLLNAFIGKTAKNEVAAKRRLAADSVKQTKELNAQGRAELGDRAPSSGAVGEKDPNLMSLAELEKLLKGQVIYQRR